MPCRTSRTLRLAPVGPSEDHRPVRSDRKGSRTVVLERVTVRNQTPRVGATVLQALEREGSKGDAGKSGAGAGVGAIIGGILGGFKGVLTGILVGGGGVIAATEGQDVTLPAGGDVDDRRDRPFEIPLQRQELVGERALGDHRPVISAGGSGC